MTWFDYALAVVTGLVIGDFLLKIRKLLQLRIHQVERDLERR